MTKYYSPEHLENIPEWYILALEKFFKRIEEENITSADELFGRCPVEEYFNTIFLEPFGNHYEGTCLMCPEFIGYDSNYCPCHYYKSYSEAKRFSERLILWWRDWAQLKEGE